MSVDHQRQYGKSNREVKCCDFEFERLGYMRTLTHTYTHINVAFQTQTNGRGGGGSCAVATTDLCNDMKINTCGENSSG